MTVPDVSLMVNKTPERLNQSQDCLTQGNHASAVMKCVTNMIWLDFAKTCIQVDFLLRRLSEGVSNGVTRER